MGERDDRHTVHRKVIDTSKLGNYPNLLLWKYVKILIIKTSIIALKLQFIVFGFVKFETKMV